MTCRYPLYIEEERHRALGRDATFPWSRALTGPRTRHRVVRGRGGHLGAAILACDVIYAKGAPILLPDILALDIPHIHSVTPLVKYINQFAGQKLQ